MKHLILVIIALSFLLSSCGPSEPVVMTPIEKIEDMAASWGVISNFQSHIKSSLNDPSSYEYVKSGWGELNEDTTAATIFVHFTAKNGFGGRVRSEALFRYRPLEGKYTILGLRKWNERKFK